MTERYPPQLGVAPMTIIAFVRESEDTLLLAADRQFTGDGIRDLHVKLRRVTNQQIAWSSSGNSAIGLGEFGGWLEACDFNKKGWGSFLLEAMQKLNELNSNQRKSMEASGAKLKDEDICAEVMIVGWLDGKMGAYELTRSGQPINVLGYNFNAIGSGGKFALVARAAIGMCGANLDCLTTLRIVMKSVAGHVDGCLEPIDI